MIKKALTVVLVTAAVLAAAEAALRLWFPLYTVGIREAYQYDSELGYRLKPGIHLFQTTDHQEEIHTNRLGTVNFQETFDGYRMLIFALGDSYTQGTGLPADAAYPFQLELSLNRDQRGLYVRRYAVVNLGLAAFGGEQSWITLRRYAGSLGKPAVVLYLGAENDYSDDVLFQGGYRHKHLVDGSPHWGWMLKPLQWATRTELGKRARLMRASATPASGGPPLPGLSTAELERPQLDKIAQTCREYNAVLVVSWSYAPSASYDWLKAWAATKGIAFADWWPTVSSVRSSISAVPLQNPHSGGHLRGWVLRLIADEFARQIHSLP